jgi:predicted transcriptional regulator
LAGIILTGGREPDADTVQKAEEEGIPILVSPLFTFELVGRLYQIGISGMSPC